MAEIRALFFWLGGVVTQPLFNVISNLLAKEAGHSEENFYALSGTIELIDDFSLGKMDDMTFCKRVGEVAGFSFKPRQLKEKIIKSLIPNPKVTQIIGLLPVNIQRWLIIDYPQSWFDQISERLEIRPCFSSDRMIFLEKAGLNEIIPDLLTYLTQISHLPINQCSLIDQNSRRSIQTLRYGMPAAIFVNARILEREFVLKRFIGQTQFIHHPPAL